MKQKRFKEEQIVQILKEGEASKSISQVYRKHGIAGVTYYRWRWPSSGAGSAAAGYTCCSRAKAGV